MEGEQRMLSNTEEAELRIRAALNLLHHALDGDADLLISVRGARKLLAVAELRIPPTDEP